MLAGGIGNFANYVGIGINGFNNIVCGASAAGQFRTTINGTASSSPTTGALVIATGGIGVSGSVWGAGTGNFAGGISTNSGTNIFSFAYGSWVPSIQTNGGLFGTTTFSYNTGTYTRVGKAYHCVLSMSVVCSGGPANSPVFITLPATADSLSPTGSGYQCLVLPQCANTGTTGPFYGQVNTSQAFFYVWSFAGVASTQSGPAGAYTITVNANFTYYGV